VIVVKKIAIKEFRGIRELTLDLSGKSFAICGPNGTGKSGVVDAIEFVLTGNISRLGGEGRGDLSVVKHAPHVDSRDNPERAQVTAELFIPSLGKTATVTRTVKQSSTPSIQPTDAEVISVLRQVGEHPEFVLSRRELIKYVLATPGKRAEEVSALLHLDRVGDVRQALQKISNAATKSEKVASLNSAEAKAKLVAALGTDTLSIDTTLTAANTRRVALGLTPLTELTESTSLKDGVQSGVGATAQRISKAQAQADTKHLRDVLDKFSTKALLETIASARAVLQKLQREPLVVDGVQREKFINAGLALITKDECPFCEKPWNPDDLRRQVAQKVVALEAAAKKKGEVERQLEPVVAVANQLENALHVASGVGERLPKTVVVKAIDAYRARAAEAKAALEELLPIAPALAALDLLEARHGAMEEDLAALETAIVALPDPSSADAARDWLTVAQDRLENYRDHKRSEHSAKTLADTSKRAFDIYTTTADGVLGSIYTEVQKDFATLYAAINPDDESQFQAKLLPSASKLGFDVDFYGKGLFPPGAYHSEGHQDGMGLCLYLALMRHLQGANFLFAVLDDVVMSVDVGHRREVCRVLKEQFPNTQFILTTHDRIWMRHMKTEGVIGNRAGVFFRSWDVDHGPAQWEDKDVWGEIDEFLKQDNVHAAAGTLRKYLEFTAGELCHALRAQVEYRGDAQYQLGELLPSAVGRMKELLRLAKAVAHSWKQDAEYARIGEREHRFNGAFNAAEGDRWQVNAAIHFNAWDNLGRQDFAPVAKAMRNLVAQFFCEKCQGVFRVVPEREDIEALRCDCGHGQLNLVKKTT
jgi:hypothetical protein